ncbi:MAG: ATP-binding domain-containing protein [Coriobacteriia bacterium]|nr:ATP-binding domain-containing protein [Coriobacteriia bacterium]
MARMIPLHIPASVDSEAERILFDELARACCADWIVLHSLDLAQRGTGPLGEADFVVIAPGYGVIVIEAKTYLARTPAGEWLTHPNGPPKQRSPFQQAGNAMHRIREWVRTHGLPDVLATCVVIVPDMDVSAGRDQIEWSARQLIDRARYRSKSLEQLLIDEFDAQRAELQHPPEPLTLEQAERIVRVLRGEVECYISPRARIESQLADVRRFTEEQFRVLDQWDGNSRVLVDGLAGTGKTLLAIEAARRGVESGRRVLFLCYNRLLSETLKAETAPLGELCTTVTIHELMQGAAGEKWKPGLTHEYWETELPEKAFDAFAERYASHDAAQYEELVVDEAQDILGNPNFLTVLDTVLLRSLAGGRWRVFGDFGHQDIFGRGWGDPREVFQRHLGYEPPVVMLRENCRNLPRVAHLAGALGEVAGGYHDCVRDDDGFNPRVLFYDGAKTAKKALVDALEGLSSEGFEPGQIVVLSRHSVRNCLAASVDVAPWRDRLRTLAEVGTGGYTGYDSILRFKGREAPAVVVTDVDPLGDSRPWEDLDDVRSLLYVGVTRALSRVVVIAHESWRDQLPWAPMDGMGLESGESVRAEWESQPRTES